MNEKEKIQKQIDKTEDKIKRLEQEKQLKGILVKKYIRCGKEGCHCEFGKKHGPYLYLQTYDKNAKKIKVKYIKKENSEEYKQMKKNDLDLKKAQKKLSELKKELNKIKKEEKKNEAK